LSDEKETKIVLSSYSDEFIVLDKYDAIAIAKVFKLTEEDLK
jgi:hypothetical protein